MIFRIDFKEEQTEIQLCKEKIDEKANIYIHTRVKNVKNNAWNKYQHTTPIEIYSDGE